MYIKCDYCKTSIERLLSEHGDDSFQIHNKCAYDFMDFMDLVYNISVCGFKKKKNFDFWCFNATFNNISAISWRSVLVLEEAGVPGENHRPWASNW
jgi:hypothetical protein